MSSNLSSVLRTTSIDLNSKDAAVSILIASLGLTLSDRLI